LADFASLKYDPQAEYYCAHRGLKLPITKMLQPGEGTSNFRCPLDNDHKPSASLYCAANGGYVLREWHGSEGDAKTHGRYYTLPEVLASQAYGNKVRLETKPEHLVWRLKLNYLAGLLEPVDVLHVTIPETVMSFVHLVYAGFRLLLGLKWTYTQDEPTTFARKFAGAWCGVTDRQYLIAMKYLLVNRYLVKDVGFEGGHKHYSTFTVGEGP
jgi:hypothetical protein